MSFLEYIFIFIQIIFEAFPVSSSGHSALFTKLFNFKEVLPKFFDHFLHGPVILILIILFYRDYKFALFNLIRGIFDRNFSKRDSYKKLLKICLKIFGYVFISSIITSIFWLLRKLYLDDKNWFNSNILLLIGFIITAIFLFLLLLANYKSKKRGIQNFENLNFKKIIILGFIQGFALLPGISRFAFIYSVSRLLNINVRRSFQITFLLQFPLVVAGFFLGVYDLFIANVSKEIFNIPVILLISLFSFISFLFLYIVRQIAVKKKLWLFGFYMFIPILILIWLINK